jgi:hypothetical protein
MAERATNKITRANAGGPRRLPIRAFWAARIAQFWRWAGAHQVVDRSIQRTGLS